MYWKGFRKRAVCCAAGREARYTYKCQTVLVLGVAGDEAGNAPCETFYCMLRPAAAGT